MAWNGTRDWAVGEVLTSGNMDTYISENLAHLYGRPLGLPFVVFDKTSVLVAGTYNATLPPMPSILNTYLVTDVLGSVFTTSSGNNVDIKMARGRQAAAGSAHTWNYIFTTDLYIDAGEYYSKDAGTQAVIGATYDDVNTGDLYRVDVIDAGTSTAGLFMTMEFEPE